MCKGAFCLITPEGLCVLRSDNGWENCSCSRVHATASEEKMCVTATRCVFSGLVTGGLDSNGANLDQQAFWLDAIMLFLLQGLV